MSPNAHAVPAPAPAGSATRSPRPPRSTTPTRPCSTNEAGNIRGANVATALYSQAMPTPVPISVHMFGLRLAIDCRQRTKNGQPAHRPPAPTAPVQPSFGRRCQPLQPVASHCQNGNDDRKWQRPPEPATEVHELRTLSLVEARHQGLECHATYRAAPGSVPTNLGVHRACVDRARCSDGRRSLRPYDRRGNGSRVLVRLCNELRTALCTAEVVALPMCSYRCGVSAVTSMPQTGSFRTFASALAPAPCVCPSWS